MTDTPAPKTIDEALFMLQQDPPVLVKDQDGQVGNQKTKYADLKQANDKILSRLTALGVLWKTKPTTVMIKGQNGQEDPRFMLQYTLLHVASGTSEQGLYPLPAGANPMQNGSAITYARRYALIAVTNSIAENEDDDGRGYADRRGMAQRANVRQEQTRPRQDTAQRAQPPAPRGERAQPTAQPDLPPARQQRPARQDAAAAAVPDERHRGRGGLITEAMTRKLAISMKQAGAEDGNVRKELVTSMIGRQVGSTKELTFDEGRAMIDAFEKANGAGGSADDRFAMAIDVYWRTTGSGPQDPPAEPVDNSVRAQTRRSVTGDPGGAGAEEPPPWDEPQQGELMPEPHTPQYRRGEGE